MSAFKQFTTKDVVITPFDANKRFSFTGTAITASDVGIEVYKGFKPTSSLFISSSATPTGFVFTQNTTSYVFPFFVWQCVANNEQTRRK